MKNLAESTGGGAKETLAERVSTATYGTVLIIAALVVIDADDVASGWGWELIAGVGVATWIAHLYAEVLGHHVLNPEFERAHEIRVAMRDGLPILGSAVLPALILGLGVLGVLDARLALWIAVAVALLQLIGLGVFVGVIVPDEHASSWRYATTTTVFGVGVVLLLVALGH